MGHNSLLFGAIHSGQLSPGLFSISGKKRREGQSIIACTYSTGELTKEKQMCLVRLSDHIFPQLGDI